MGILGVVVVLDEVELDVVLGTHLTMALGASSNASISSWSLSLPFLLVVLWWKIILILCPFERSRIILLLLRNKLCLGVLIFFPLNSISIELSFKTNTLILPVPSLLAYNLLELLTSGKALVNTFLYNSLQKAIFLLKCNLAKRIISGIERTTKQQYLTWLLLLLEEESFLLLLLDFTCGM